MAGLTTSAAGEQVSGARRMFNKAVWVLECSCSLTAPTFEYSNSFIKHRPGAADLLSRSRGGQSSHGYLGGLNEGRAPLTWSPPPFHKPTTLPRALGSKQPLLTGTRCGAGQSTHCYLSILQLLTRNESESLSHTSVEGVNPVTETFQ